MNLGVRVIANVAHASLTGAELHEPKGAATANAGEVYISDGAGSGTWGSIGTSSFTGTVVDYTGVFAPAGWLECNGTDISIVTYEALYNVMSHTVTGTRNGTTTISSIADTTGIRIGFYVFGTGITSGTTVTAVTANTITLSIAASGSGTSDVVVSPWLLNTGTIRLPDLTTSGRYRRSRTGTVPQGAVQADQNLAHTHAVSGVTGSENAVHQHAVIGNTGVESATHTHDSLRTTVGSFTAVGGGAGTVVGSLNEGVAQTSGVQSANHVHALSIVSGDQLSNHQHSFSATSGSSGSTEARPLTVVFMTIVKT